MIDFLHVTEQFLGPRNLVFLDGIAVLCVPWIRKESFVKKKGINV